MIPLSFIFSLNLFIFWVQAKMFVQKATAVASVTSSAVSGLSWRNFHASVVCNHIIKLTRLRVVDNSEIGKQAMAEGKPPRCIHIYNKKGIGTIGEFEMLKEICLDVRIDVFLTCIHITRFDLLAWLDYVKISKIKSGSDQSYRKHVCKKKSPRSTSSI